ncbi:MAG: NAD(P)H-dependent oxidoreductase [Candidatus Latescibacterota bacterium]|nr:MAG: NAD(P)H-dependent oxidoreductase [Candidatus Latescibacterota bacterium]
MSQKPRILAFAGSARKGSYNKKLVKIAAAGAEKNGAVVTYVDLRDLPMPIYDADLETAEGLPANAVEFKRLLATHDGFLIASPENNGTISALLKNVIDWASRRLEGEPAYAGFEGRVAAIMAASPGALGGIRGLTQLRVLLENMKVMVLPDQRALSEAHKAFLEDGSLVDSKTQAAVESIGAKLADTVSRLKR